MSEEVNALPRFNLYEVACNEQKFSGLLFYKRVLSAEEPARRSFRAKTFEQFSKGNILAKHYESGVAWFMATSDLAKAAPELMLIPVPFSELPKSAILTFWSSFWSETAGASAVFFGTGEKYWQVVDKEKEKVCIYPKFQMHGAYVTCLIHTTTFKRVRSGESKDLRKTPYVLADDGWSYVLGHPLQDKDSYIRARENRFRRHSVPWLDPKFENGPLSCKSAFLKWLVESLNGSGFITVTAVEPAGRPISDVMGKDWTKSNLKTAALQDVVKSKLSHSVISLWDGRSQKEGGYAWSDMVEALGVEITKIGLSFRDAGEVKAGDSFRAEHALVCIDNPDYIKKGEYDSKEDVVKAFESSVQCFTDDVFSTRKPRLKTRDEATRELYKNQSPQNLYASSASVLQMLNNEIIKGEIEHCQLIYPRRWVMDGIEFHAFMGVFKKRGEPNRWAAVHIDRQGVLSFIEGDKIESIQVQLKRRGLIGVYRSDPNERLNVVSRLIEITPTSIRALPQSVKRGLSSYFTGIQIIDELGAYYSGGSDAPDIRQAIDRAIVVRACRHHGDRGSWGINEIAASCYDPHVRLGQATVWPGPFKLLNEYMRMKHGALSLEDATDQEADAPE